MESVALGLVLSAASRNQPARFGGRSIQREWQRRGGKLTFRPILEARGFFDHLAPAIQCGDCFYDFHRGSTKRKIPPKVGLAFGCFSPSGIARFCGPAISAHQ